jgi:multicomponent Na+:H+ antiporter subunit G
MSVFIGFLSSFLMALGLFFAFASVVGLIRFPDVYTRVHAGTKALSGGAMLILIGVAMRAPSWQGAVKSVLIALFFLATNPLASHAISRACYRHGIAPHGTVLDEYGEAMEDRS